MDDADTIRCRVIDVTVTEDAYRMMVMQEEHAPCGPAGAHHRLVYEEDDPNDPALREAMEAVRDEGYPCVDLVNPRLEEDPPLDRLEHTYVDDAHPVDPYDG